MRQGLTAATKLAAICGWPVEHSLSPSMHNAAFQASGLDWVYVGFPVAPAGAAESLRAAWALGVSGLSVTMPHKQAALEAAVTASDTAKRIGAADTLVRTPDGWEARNTDGSGFRNFLDADLGYAVAGRRVGVIGAGGVASAVVDALAGDTDVRVWNRTTARADALVGRERTLEHPAELRECDLVVGCLPAPVGAELTDALRGAFHSGQVVVDLVYTPPRTPLMELAAQAGAEVHNGLGMLVHQAALQFTLWTGVEAPIEVMSAAATAGLATGTV